MKLITIHSMAQCRCPRGTIIVGGDEDGVADVYASDCRTYAGEKRKYWRRDRRDAINTVNKAFRKIYGK